MNRSLAAFLAAASVAATALSSPAGAQDAGLPDYVESYRQRDEATVALNVLPPGQGRYMNSGELALAQATGQQPEQNTDQIAMYDRLVQEVPGLSRADLRNLFKDASFGARPEEVESVYSPRDGVTVLRDSYSVPHVYGHTRSDVMFGAGYVTAEDRLFMLDVLRHVGRGRASEFLGASEANLAMDRAYYATAGYTEEELQAMIDRLPELDPELGALARQDLLDYTAGINRYIAEARSDPSKLPGEYTALQQVPEDWKPTDSVAVASLIGSQLGVGGGSELRNAAFVRALMDTGYSRIKARRILADLRFADDPEAPTTADRPFPYGTRQGRIDPDSVAMPDAPVRTSAPSPPARLDGPFGPIRLALPEGASNALLVGAKLAAGGRPLAVFGPQVGYWSPEILMELDLHGPGIHARGVGFPGISQYVLLGRGIDYAWSATSAGGDQVDIFAERLCDPEGSRPDPDSDHYLADDGRCVPMYTRTDTWIAKPSAGGFPPEPGEDAVVVSMTTERTDDGIVQARGTVGGQPVAFVAKRASFGSEVDSALAYVEISDPARIDSALDFRRAFARFAFTFNWFYLDRKDIAYQLGGYHPLRARHTDLDLPVWGDDPRWDWRGMLSFADTPFSVSPPKGYITSWNNKQAPGFRANDAQYSYGPVHRSQPLDRNIRRAARDGRVTLVELVWAMGEAATVDLRGVRVLPVMLDAVGRPRSPRLRRAVRLLRAWRATGAHRRDLDRDGSYEHSPAIALMDEWWARAARAVFRPRLGAAWRSLPFGLDNAPGPLGSAYQNGIYSHLHKDLRTVLGHSVRGHLSTLYCGRGSLPDCRRALRRSLRAAVRALSRQFGGGPSTWDPDEGADAIRYTPVGIQGQQPMQWQNRPTFQQVLRFGR